MANGSHPSDGNDVRIERDARAWLAEMIDNPELHRRGLEEWLAGDPRRQEIYDRLASKLDAASEAASRIRARRPVPPQSLWAKCQRPVWAVGMAATAVLAIGSAVMLFVAQSPMRTESRIADGQPATASTRFATRVGEVRVLRLADGSAVTLDTDSVLTVIYTEGQRHLSLGRGRARFEVAHDSARPFIVFAGGGTVTAKGTIFDVRLRPGDGVDVALIRGEIDVALPRRGGPVAEPTVERLQPGQHIYYASDNGSKSAGPISPTTAPASEADWVTGMMDFDEVPLGEVIAEANRYTVAKIELADPALADLKVFGTFRIRDTARLADNLARTLNLKVDREHDRFVLRRK